MPLPAEDLSASLLRSFRKSRVPLVSRTPPCLASAQIGSAVSMLGRVGRDRRQDSRWRLRRGLGGDEDRGMIAEVLKGTAGP
jgi:hypothetical protein